MKWFESTFRIWEDSSNSYAARLSDALNKQRLAGEFCDVTVKVNDREFSAHRGVLCAASGYFQGLLDGNFKEHGAAVVDLSKSIDDTVTLSAILDYIYTGKLLIEKDTYEKILAGISFLLLEDACHLMTSFLLENLVLENCIDILQLADRYSLHELWSVTFEILSARLHDYYVHSDRLKTVPIRILSKLADIHAFDSVAEEDLLPFVQNYLHNYANASSEERTYLGDFEEIRNLFKDTFDNEAIHIVYESFLHETQNAEELRQKLSEQEPIVMLEDDAVERQQEVLTVVSAQLLDHDRVSLIIHAYLTQSSKWIHFAEVTLPKRDHRTFKEFIGVHHTGDLLFSTEKRLAFVKRDGYVNYIDNCCFVCSQGIDMECVHKYFCFESHLFTVVPSARRNVVLSDVANPSDWEDNNLAHILSMYDSSEGDWIDIGEFCSDNLFKQHMSDIDAEVTRYPQLIFDLHPQNGCAWILALYKAPDSDISEGTGVKKDGGEKAVKLFRLVNDRELDSYKLIDVQSSFVLRNTGARNSHIRSTCCKDKLYVQSVILTDDPAFEPEILYYSGPMYTYDLAKDKWETYPWINTPTKENELNPLRGKEHEESIDSEREVEAITDGSTNRKVFNVTFTSTIPSKGKECKESGSIAPSQALPLVEFKQRRKVEHEQLIRGTNSGRHIDTYQKKVYGTLSLRTELFPSTQYGAFYQIHVLSPLVTELWQYSVKDISWQYLPPPPVDTNIMHVGACFMSREDLQTRQTEDKTIKAAKFAYDNSNHNDFRPFMNHHLKTAHEKLFSSSSR